MITPNLDFLNEVEIQPSGTAYAHVPAFCIDACSGELHDQDRRKCHTNDAKHWIIDKNERAGDATPSPRNRLLQAQSTNLVQNVAPYAVRA